MKKTWMIVIGIIVIAVLVYGGYRVMHHMSAQKQMQEQAAAVTSKKMVPSPTMEAMTMTKNSVYGMESDPKLGSIVTDTKGMTLYTYAKDTAGVSNCSGGCLAAWPAYVAPAQTGDFPENITAIKRSDGTFQYAWKGMPLYYYADDTKPGDVTGNGVGRVWSVVK